MTPEQEKAPVVSDATDQGAQNQNTNHHEGELIMPIIADTTEHREAIEAYIAKMIQLQTEHAPPHHERRRPSDRATPHRRARRRDVRRAGTRRWRHG